VQFFKGAHSALRLIGYNDSGERVAAKVRVNAAQRPRIESNLCLNVLFDQFLYFELRNLI
jgi:hypothetical protein